MLKREFAFAVSLFAVMSVGNAYATTPSGTEAVSEAHTVYTAASNAGASGAATNIASGIAGVTYVNRMVNLAGNAAQKAEDHAAAAGASAIVAKQAADDAATEAAKVANKQDKSTAVTHTASTAVGTTGKPVYIASSGAATVVTGIDASLLPAATTSVKGAVIVDGALSSTSTNPVQNKAVNTALATKEAAANKLKTGDEVQITDSNKDVLFPTIGRVNALVEDLNADVTGEISTLTAGIRDLNTDLGNLSSTVSTNEQDIENKVANKQDKSTAVTHTASTAVGTTGKPVYIASNGAATVVTSIDSSLLPVASSTLAGLAKWGQIPSGGATATTYATIWVE